MILYHANAVVPQECHNRSRVTAAVQMAAVRLERSWVLGVTRVDSLM
jgi:hypothetical protein